jgi:hypothetical protein
MVAAIDLILQFEEIWKGADGDVGLQVKAASRPIYIACDVAYKIDLMYTSFFDIGS